MPIFGVPRLDTCPPAYSSLRHRLAVRGPRGGARWTRTSGWARARRSAPHTLAEAGPRPRRGGGGGPPPNAAAARVGGPRAGGRAAAAAGRGPGAGLARARGDGRRAERLAGGLPGRRRGVDEEPAGGCAGCRDRPPEGEGRRADDGHRAPRGQDRAAGDRPPFSPEEVEAMSREVSPSTAWAYGLQRVARLWGVSRATVYRHRRR